MPKPPWNARVTYRRFAKPPGLVVGTRRVDRPLVAFFALAYAIAGSVFAGAAWIAE